jgi:hypothetical protein
MRKVRKTARKTSRKKFKKSPSYNPQTGRLTGRAIGAQERMEKLAAHYMTQGLSASDARNRAREEIAPTLARTGEQASQQAGSPDQRLNIYRGVSPFARDDARDLAPGIVAAASSALRWSLVLLPTGVQKKAIDGRTL